MAWSSGVRVLRYDACIIGAGAEGLACAAVLGRRGVRVAVIERAAAPGGRCVTKSFAPGFSASPYADELAAIPPAIFRDLDLARRGAVLMPGSEPRGAIDDVREAVIARVLADAAVTPSRAWFRRARPAPPWPGEELATRASIVCGGEGSADSDRGALALLAGPPGGLPRGGLGALGAALRSAAEAAGAEISCGLEVTDIRRRRGRVVAVGLADGSEIAANAVISTLDLKRTFLALFAWNELPKTLVERIATFRAAPSIARLLLALDTPPELPKTADRAILRRPIVVAASHTDALRAWAAGLIPERPPAVLRLVSAVDPFLAPDGGAVLTVTLHAIPHTLFDGPWTNDKRARLQTRALVLVDEVFPGTSAKIKAAELIVPPDIESQLGLTEGDLAGGALSPSQMLSFRPFPEMSGTRTPVAGLYLAGGSSALGPLATCASGVAAAIAVLTDLGADTGRGA
jgi:phytoene dehydrogenase-like protein